MNYRALSRRIFEISGALFVLFFVAYALIRFSLFNNPALPNVDSAQTAPLKVQDKTVFVDRAWICILDILWYFAMICVTVGSHDRV
jgi:hypothetical protein